jgi:hypothetical protein
LLTRSRSYLPQAEPDHDVSKDHIHAVDSVSVQVANGRTGEEALRNVGRAMFLAGGFSHVAPNTQPAVMRYIVVELTKSERPGAASVTLPNHTLELENNRVRVYRVRLAAGESMDTHTHPAGRMDVTVAGPGGPGAYSWIAGELAIPSKRLPIRRWISSKSSIRGQTTRTPNSETAGLGFEWSDPELAS